MTEEEKYRPKKNLSEIIKESLYEAAEAIEFTSSFLSSRALDISEKDYNNLLNCYKKLAYVCGQLKLINEKYEEVHLSLPDRISQIENGISEIEKILIKWAN